MLSDNTANRSRESRRIDVAAIINFPPSERALNCIELYFLASKKSKGRTGCQLVLPLPRVCIEPRETPGRRACEPHGEKVARILRYTLQAARRGGYACPRISRY